MAWTSTARTWLAQPQRVITQDFQLRTRFDPTWRTYQLAQGSPASLLESLEQGHDKLSAVIVHVHPQTGATLTMFKETQAHQVLHYAECRIVQRIWQDRESLEEDSPSGYEEEQLFEGYVLFRDATAGTIKLEIASPTARLDHARIEGTLYAQSEGTLLAGKQPLTPIPPDESLEAPTDTPLVYGLPRSAAAVGDLDLLKGFGWRANDDYTSGGDFGTDDLALAASLSGAGTLAAGDYLYAVTAVVSADGYPKEAHPSFAAITVGGADGVQLDWGVPTIGGGQSILSYRVYRSPITSDAHALWANLYPTSDTATLIATVTVGTETYTDTGGAASAGYPPFLRRAWEAGDVRLHVSWTDSRNVDPDDLWPVELDDYETFFTNGAVHLRLDPALLLTRLRDKLREQFDDTGIVLDDTDPETAFFIRGARPLRQGTNNIARILRIALTQPFDPFAQPHQAIGPAFTSGEIVAIAKAFYDPTNTTVLDPVDLDKISWDKTQGSVTEFIGAVRKSALPTLRVGWDHANSRLTAGFIAQTFTPPSTRVYDLELLPLAGEPQVDANAGENASIARVFATRTRPVNFAKEWTIVDLLDPDNLVGSATVGAGRRKGWKYGASIDGDTAGTIAQTWTNGDPDWGSGWGRPPNSAFQAGGLNPWGNAYPLQDFDTGFVRIPVAHVHSADGLDSEIIERFLLVMGLSNGTGSGSTQPQFTASAAIYVATAADISAMGGPYVHEPTVAHIDNRWRLLDPRALQEGIPTDRPRAVGDEKTGIENPLVSVFSDVIIYSNVWKDGLANADRPSYTIMELAMFERSKIVVEAALQVRDARAAFYAGATHEITDVDLVGNAIAIPGNYTTRFRGLSSGTPLDPPVVLRIADSTGNDGFWTVAASTYDSGDDETVIVPEETLPDATVDGVVAGGPYEAFGTQLLGPQFIAHPPGFGHLVYEEDREGTLSELQAQLYANQLLASKLLNPTHYILPTLYDPMVKKGMTVRVVIPTHGIDTTILVDDVRHEHFARTIVEGRDLLGPPVGAVAV